MRRETTCLPRSSRGCSAPGSSKATDFTRAPVVAAARAHPVRGELEGVAEVRLEVEPDAGADLAGLIADVLEPPMEILGALPIDGYLSPRQRGDLAADLNNLLASPAFVQWRHGQDLDVGKWMEPVDGKTPRPS